VSEELLARFDSILKALAAQRLNTKRQSADAEIIESGTTVAAINCGRKGVVIGAEGRVSMVGGGTIRTISDAFKKLATIDNFSVLAFAGDVGAGITIRQHLRYFLGTWRDSFGVLISTKGKARTLSKLAAATSADIALILAMWDPQRVRDSASGAFLPRGGQLYLFNKSAYLEVDWAVIGSGGDTIRRQVREYCERVPRNSRDPKDAAFLINHLLADVGRDDPHSGGKPHVLLVNETGVIDVVFDLIESNNKYKAASTQPGNADDEAKSGNASGEEGMPDGLS
jgi:20S proteasome alpha/beta subunit